ncbi:MAG TPA: phosphoribosylformylglycinamidine synthase subunit PurS [Dongiaceae bacterium]|jgi:phosphoribosylformylglycinamidine synthase|nr:phosphoribosylformylglycinamidine synthase subunit PurS [Dongiaceae bacterium]
MKARIHVTLKPGVLDPQGQAICQALHHLGHAGVADVRQGKYFELTLPDMDEGAAQAMLQDMCERLLANTIIENYRVDLVK